VPEMPWPASTIPPGSAHRRTSARRIATSCSTPVSAGGVRVRVRAKVRVRVSVRARARARVSVSVSVSVRVGPGGGRVTIGSAAWFGPHLPA
jgi:hypothetical protein